MFSFRLALQLGCTVEELGQRMTATEFDMWRVFETFEPFGAPADDFRAGLYPLMKIAGGRKAGQKALTMSDLFPWAAHFAKKMQSLGKFRKPTLTPAIQAHTRGKKTRREAALDALFKERAE
ncbi:MAG: hypothetical protein ING73_17165 [Rhodocyclaceae bacterium]|nr:hypothetical protein [Rhodocyclaceae bacterium]